MGIRFALAPMVAVALVLGGCTSTTLEDDYTREPQEPVERVPDNDPPDDYQGGTCVDVTSYDQNWDNDVLCTRDDGSEFYTSYEGADEFLAGH